MDPDAKASPESSLREGSFAKTPSRRAASGLVSGIARWPEKRSTRQEVALWAAQGDYGICLQTRIVRALDVDIDDAIAATAVRDCITETLDLVPPMRTRASSPRFVLAFHVASEGQALRKRVIRTAHGALEFLGDGQQFLVAGRHKSGDRYQWAGGLPEAIPTLDLATFERLWAALADRFAVEPPVKASDAERRNGERLSLADPVADYLMEKALIIGEGAGGALYVECPWQHTHTSDTGASATAWFPAGTRGYERGHFKCLHAHCTSRSDADFVAAIGFDVAQFEALPPLDVPASSPRRKFTAIPLSQFVDRPSPEWRIKSVLPMTGVSMIYGAPGAGKSFLALDIAMAIVRGVSWRGHRVRRGRVMYVCAEGAAGFVDRVKAYLRQADMQPCDGLYLVDGRPDLVSATGADADELIQTAKDVAADLVIIDTLAQAMPGGDENSSSDMGRAIARCQQLRDMTGALVMLVHHAGKDESRGARGWSGLKGAVDVEIAVARPSANDPTRVATITKQKDGEAGAAYPFRLVPVALGEDADGDDITSCVVEEAEAVPVVTRARGPGPNEHAILAALEANGGPLAMTDLVASAIESLPPSEDGKRDRRKEYVSRALAGLVASGAIVQEGDILQSADAARRTTPHEAACGETAQARDHAARPHTPLGVRRAAGVRGK